MQLQSFPDVHKWRPSQVPADLGTKRKKLTNELICQDRILHMRVDEGGVLEETLALSVTNTAHLYTCGPTHTYMHVPVP